MLAYYSVKGTLMSEVSGWEWCTRKKDCLWGAWGCLPGRSGSGVFMIGEKK